MDRDDRLCYTMVALGVTVLVLLLFLVYSLNKRDEIHSKYEQGVRYYIQEDYESAIEILKPLGKYGNAPEIVKSAEKQIVLLGMVNREQLANDILTHNSKWAYKQMKEIVSLGESEAVEWLDKRVKE